MRTVYLIRHGHPDFPLGAHMCLGRTDTPLGPLGRMQACLLGEALGGRDLTVFSSPLSRCRETAAPLSPAPVLAADLAEQDMGPWDGLDFDAIRVGWPTLYARRRDEPLLVPPGAETLAAVQARTLPALGDCLRQSAGNVAIVAHASVIQALLAALGGTALEDSRPLRPPYGTWAELALDRLWHIRRRAVLPDVPLTAALAEKLLTAAAPGERIEAHCRAVAREARRIASELPMALDAQLLESAALLHDIARAAPDHAALAAAWLRELGYGAAARLVERHHDPESTQLDEAAVLFLADKCVREDRRVSLDERFEASLAGCRDEEALRAHRRRREAAEAWRERINRLCGKDVIV